MALFQCSFFSKTLCMMTKVLVCLPTPCSSKALTLSLEELHQRGNFKVLYLLHGMFEDETIWLRRSNVERYASEENIAVIMPAGENNYYLDMVHGLPYFTYLTKELPLFIEASFGIKHDRENTSIAGLSMGGYGACLAAFTRPDLYSGFGSFSGAVDMELLKNKATELGMQAVVENIIGTVEVKNSHADLFYLVKRLMESGTTLPQGYISCGTEDTDCYSMNQKLKDYLESLQYPFVYQEGKGGHEWDFWDKEIQTFLRWLNR